MAYIHHRLVSVLEVNVNIIIWLSVWLNIWVSRLADIPPTVWMSLVAGTISLTAFALYNLSVFTGRIKPNSASWALFAFLVILNASSYLAMSDDWVKSVMPIGNAGACILTFVFGLIFGKFEPLKPEEKKVLIIGMAAALAWWMFRSAMFGNLLLQVAVIVAMLPLLKGVRRNPTIENPLPWWLWTIGFTINLTVVILRWKGQWQDLAYPINTIVLHAWVAILASRKLPQTITADGGEVN